MNGPLRLRDDPRFIEETGIRLEVEHELLSLHDLGKMQRTLIGSIRAGFITSIVLCSAIASAAIGGAWIAIQPVEEIVLPAPPARTASPVKQARLVARTAEKPRPAKSELSREIASLEAAKAALGRGEARARLETHRARFPDGALFAEASLLLFELHQRNGRFVEVTLLGEELLARRDCAHRRSEIQRAMGDASMILGRCDDGRRWLEQAGAPASAIAAAHAHCRRSR